MHTFFKKTILEAFSLLQYVVVHHSLPLPSSSDKEKGVGSERKRRPEDDRLSRTAVL